MNLLTKVFGGLGAFYLMMFLIYGVSVEWNEWTGVPALLLSCLMCWMIAFYFWRTDAAQDDLPEDDNEGEITDVAGDYGHFSPHSWWPLALGSSIALTSLGLAVGWWLVVMAVPLVALTSIGWVFEYYRGIDAV